jgi:hypothetical protein
LGGAILKLDRIVKTGCVIFCFATAVTSGIAQSFNIDLEIGFGGPGVGEGVPNPTFGAVANQQGFWNAAPATGPNNFPLRNLSGAMTSATILATGGVGGGGGWNNMSNTGDFRLLLNDGGDVENGFAAYTISGLSVGIYDVVTYVVHPLGDVRFATVTVPGSTSPNPQSVTGPMPGNQFILGITHSVHRVSSLNGTIAVQINCELQPRSAIVNGFQLSLVPEPAALIGLAFGVLALFARKRKLT